MYTHRKGETLNMPISFETATRAHCESRAALGKNESVIGAPRTISIPPANSTVTQLGIRSGRASAKPRVQSVARAVAIIQFVAADNTEGVAPKEIAGALNIPRQVVYHLIHTLVSVGVLRKVSGSKCALDMGLATVAKGFRRQLACADMFETYASEAAALTGETAYVSSWTKGEIVAQATAHGPLSGDAHEIPRGTTGYAHARSAGKLLLAKCDEVCVADYLKRHPLVPRTKNTITTSRALLRQLADIRRDNVSIDIEEYSDGVSCLAIPLGFGAHQAALSISAPTIRLTKNKARYLEMLHGVVERVHE